MKINTLIVVSACLFSSCAHARTEPVKPPPALSVIAQAQLFDGDWQNDRGSRVSLTVTDGMLSGVYQTNVGRPDKNKKFPLTGYVSGDMITFTVNFAGFNSMTAWTGQMTKDGQGNDVIKTLWQNTKDVPDEDEPAEMWGSIRAGASDFRKVNP